MESYQSSGSVPLAVTVISTLVSKAVSTTLMAPLYFVQTRYQVMTEMKRNGLIQQTYRSYSDCIMTAVNQQNGWKTLWKGNFSKILMGWTGTMFSLLAGEYGKQLITKLSKAASREDLIHSKYLGNIAGLMSSLVGVAITYPFEYAYVRLVSDKQSVTKNGVKKFQSIISLFRLTLEGDGIRGLYRGMFTSFGAIALYRVAYFGLYDLWRSLSTKKYSLFETFIISYMITLTSSFIAYPLNTIRKRMMMRSLENQKYKWSGDCLNYILKNQGFRALYRGYPMALLSAISSSLFLVTYDRLKGGFSVGVQ